MTERTDSSLVVLVSTGLTVGTITTLFTPLDVLKNVVQHQPSLRFGSASQMLYQQKGVQAFWRGASSAFAAAYIQQATYFLSYEKLRLRLDNWNQQLSPFVSAAVSRTLSASVSAPIERLRTQKHSTGTGSLDLDLRGFRGLLISLLRNAVQSGVTFGIAENYYQAYKESQGNAKARGIGTAIGAILGIILSHPLDLLKNRYQTRYCCYGRQGILQSFVKIAQIEGYKGLMKGFWLRIGRAVPSNIVALQLYELFKKHIRTEL